MNKAHETVPSMAQRRVPAAAVAAILLAACTATQPPPDDAGGANPATPAATGPQAVHATNATAPSRHWRVVGTEPFWSVRVDGRSLLFATPENPAGRTLAARGEWKEDGAVEFRGDDRGKPFVLRLVRGECSDGMSDRRYALTATFGIDATRYRGCADEEWGASSESSGD